MEGLAGSIIANQKESSAEVQRVSTPRAMLDGRNVLEVLEKKIVLERGTSRA